MTRTKIISLVAVLLFAAPLAASAAMLTETQIQSVASLLTSFGVSSSVVTNITNTLRGTTATFGSSGSYLGPTVSSISVVDPTGTVSTAASTISQSTLPLIINGSGFQPGAIVTYSGPSFSGSLSATYISSTQLRFGPYSYVPGIYTFSVKNPDGRVSQGTASMSVGASSVTINPSGGVGGVSPSLATTAPASVPVPIPKSCFGRSVNGGDWDDPAYRTSDKGEQGGSSASSFTSAPNRMHILRFKTDSAGYFTAIDNIMDANIAITAFVSNKPCDYGFAYERGLVGQNGIAIKFDLPVLTDSQAATVFSRDYKDYKLLEPNIYSLSLGRDNNVGTVVRDSNGNVISWNKKKYLLPDTYYYLHVINASVITSSDSQGSNRSELKTNAELTAAPDTCAESGGVQCGYRIMRIWNHPNNDNKIPVSILPTTAATAVSCGAGETFNPNSDRDWTTFNNGNLYPAVGQSFQASGSTGIALKFVPTTNRGIVAVAGYGPGAQENKEMFISKCPHNFTKTASGQPLNYCRKTGVELMSLWVSTQGSVVGNECTLENGQTYYLNVRPFSQSGETSTQLGYSAQSGYSSGNTSSGNTSGSTGSTNTPPADTSTCALPPGGTLSAATYQTASLWYRNGPNCWFANFYCKSGTLTYGVQFSPAPPPPTTTGRFADYASCIAS